MARARKRDTVMPTAYMPMAKDRYDLMRDYILHGDDLSDTAMKARAENIRQVYPILVEALSTKETVDRITDMGICNQREAMDLVRDAERVYGRIQMHSENGLRNILTETGLDMLRMARDAGDYNAAARLIEKIGNLQGLFDNSAKQEQIYNLLVLPAIKVTDEPTALDAEVIEVHDTSA